MSLKIIQKVNNPVLLIITPLLTGHSVFKECKHSLKRNTLPFDWISYEGEGEKPENLQSAITEYTKNYTLPEYIQILDRDIICGRYMVDRLYNTLSTTKSDIGFAYCPFEFKGHINMKVTPIKYNINTLMVKNYISGNSMFKTTALSDIGFFNAEKYLHRLNDWALFLRLYQAGYSGILCENTSFIAISNKNDISAGDNDEYTISYKYVIDNYVKRIKNRRI